MPLQPQKQRRRLIQMMMALLDTQLELKFTSSLALPSFKGMSLPTAMMISYIGSHTLMVTLKT